MAVKLHRCPHLWANFGKHPCWTVQKALDDTGVEYEVVKESWPIRKATHRGDRGNGSERRAGDRARERHLVPRGVGADGEGDQGGKFNTPAAPAGR